MTTRAKHQWAAMGVSAYPLSHPIVGQSRFFESFRHFIHLVDEEAERFAHVFAVIAPWGVGKSRLGYELVAQINQTSRGWYVRKEDDSLEPAQLFRDDAERDQYLGLYIRYSQIANNYHNTESWFGYGLYKALLPLATQQFDGSIQSEIAKEAYDRLLIRGFDERKLAVVLELAAGHTDQQLYEDPHLAARLCQNAYAYLQTLGIKYFLVILDELETAAEAATYGLEPSEIKYLDGRAITFIGKAIKEEDPRKKLPWLRYVALCSPVIGDVLREIQSTARRFELTELSANAFSDVSDFVRALEQDSRLTETYPTGLVEAAYAMSAGNFGWFNVVMASIDERLRDRRLRQENDQPGVGEIFAELVRVSGRVQEHVLDHHALDMLRLPDRTIAAAARDLLYGQLPVPLDRFGLPTRRALLDARNEYDEPVAVLFRRVEWDEVEAIEALRAAKFSREKGSWRLAGVDALLDLRQLLSNLGTYAIHETRGQRRPDGKLTLLVPLRQADFVQLIGLLYPHPAAEDAARALWRRFLGADDLDEQSATHLGPSVAMVGRLDLRHRRQGQTALVFRVPEQNAAHEKALLDTKGQKEADRARQVLVGAMRLLDQNWAYEAVSPALRRSELVVIATPPRSRGGGSGGLLTLDALKLHPRGRALLAWVRNSNDLEDLAEQASEQFNTEGRTPVVAFTCSRALFDQFQNNPSPKLRDARSFLLLYQLSSTEEHILHQLGFPAAAQLGFQLNGQGFTSAFQNRSQALLRPFGEALASWRQELHTAGRIAWPLRPTSRLKESELRLLRGAWEFLFLRRQEPASLAALDETSGVDVEELKGVLAKLKVSPKARAAGYLEAECAGLFSTSEDDAEPRWPPFLTEIVRRLLGGRSWTLDDAEREWFWGYAWEGAKPKETFLEWMSFACTTGFAGQARGVGDETKFSPIERSAMLGSIQEARNWMRQIFPRLVLDMEDVFGEGRVRDLFAPETAPQPGTKTLKARAALETAGQEMTALDLEEAAGAASMGGEALRISARRRLTLMRNVAWVYLRDEFNALTHDPNVKTLDFTDDSQPLWSRIRRASLFVAFVQQAQTRIIARVVSLGDEIRQGAPDGFPASLFTLSLEKIRHILEGALSNPANAGLTHIAQSSEPGTLRQLLRDLQVAEATSQLEKLALEVGLDLGTWQELALEAIEGQILSAYRALRQAYDRIVTDLKLAAQQVNGFKAILAEAPADFTYPRDVPSLSRLELIIGQIQESLTGIHDEEVERLRSEFDGPARLGNFQPLMSKAKELLLEPRRSLSSLQGNLITLGNVVSDYLRRLLEGAELLRTERGVNALLEACGKAVLPTLVFADLEGLHSLRSALERVQEQVRARLEIGNRELAGTCVTCQRWCGVVEALDAGRDPTLDPPEAEDLVRRNLVERTYRLGKKP